MSTHISVIQQHSVSNIALQFTQFTSESSFDVDGLTSVQLHSYVVSNRSISSRNVGFRGPSRLLRDDNLGRPSGARHWELIVLNLLSMNNTTSIAHNHLMHLPHPTQARSQSYFDPEVIPKIKANKVTNKQSIGKESISSISFRTA